MNPSPVKAVKWNAKLTGKVIMDCFLVISTALAIILIEVYVNPYQRGFFCDDVNLRYPLKDSTYPGWSLAVVLAVPLVVMAFTEGIIFKSSLKKSLVQIYKHFGIYIFGFLLHFLLVDYIKYSAGRLRPHFFDICQPVMADGTNCASPANQGLYIMNYTCSNPDITERSLKEFRLSFPSGHSSISFYAMTYLALYIHGRWNTCKILKFIVEFLCILFAVSVAVSRVSDYWHFWSDVCAGSLIGIISAALVVRFVSDLYKRRSVPNNFENQIQYLSGV
ncbi:PPAP2A.2 family protein [Megaselia abdita]